MEAAPFGEMKFLLDIKRVQQHAASHPLTLSPSYLRTFPLFPGRRRQYLQKKFFLSIIIFQKTNVQNGGTK
jgi:hypothetical protein